MAAQIAPAFMASMPLLGNANQSWAQQREKKWAAISMSTPSATSSNLATFDLHTFNALLQTSQHSLCAEIEAIDGLGKFSTNPWESDTGKGVTRVNQREVLQDGKIFEKAGVNISQVSGTLSESRAAAMTSRGRHISAGMSYEAAALSFVLHAQSPFLPTLRGDVRIFAAGGQAWGGGGCDLTIFYVDRPSFRQFHTHWRDVCDTFDPALYAQFKTQCDDYFYLPARAEHRGVGGLFYDDVQLPDGAQLFDFQKAILENFLPSFSHILHKHGQRQWSEKQKKWQRIRRGRYIEFNLLNDRGVRFGLAGAPPWRTDSIMISAPPSVEWPHNFVPDAGSPEEEALQLLSGSPLDWVNML